MPTSSLKAKRGPQYTVGVLTCYQELPEIERDALLTISRNSRFTAKNVVSRGSGSV